MKVKNAFMPEEKQAGVTMKFETRNDSWWRNQNQSDSLNSFHPESSDTQKNLNVSEDNSWWQ